MEVGQRCEHGEIIKKENEENKQKINKQKYTWDKSRGVLKWDSVSHIIINGKYHKQTQKRKNKKNTSKPKNGKNHQQIQKWKNYLQTQKWKKPSINPEMEKTTSKPRKAEPNLRKQNNNNNNNNNNEK